MEMRLLFLLGLCVCAVTICLGKDQGKSKGPWKELTEEEKAESQLPFEEQWKNFKEKNGRKYKDDKDEKERKEKFRQNKEKIDNHNQRQKEGKETFRMAFNPYSDMDSEEFVGKMTGAKKPSAEEAAGLSNVPPPEQGKRQTSPTLDYRDQGLVTSVKYQGSCGSCWAHAAIGVVEAFFAQTSTLEQLSEQWVLDCGTDVTPCVGGWMVEALMDIQANGGVPKMSDYPYAGQRQTCQNKTNVGGTIADTHYAYEYGEENIKNKLVEIGRPTTISLCVSASVQNYGSGILSSTDCQCQVNHDVLAVGYGTENGQDYWIIKNSWGSSWGNDGYLYLERNTDMCNIGWDYSYVT